MENGLYFASVSSPAALGSEKTDKILQYSHFALSKILEEVKQFNLVKQIFVACDYFLRLTVDQIRAHNVNQIGLLAFINN